MSKSNNYKTYKSYPSATSYPKSSIPLSFTPYAWAKLTWMRDRGPTEVGGFGQTASPDKLNVCDLRMPKQECTGAWCEFDDADASEMVTKMCFDEGLEAQQTNRIWIHTHPGNSASPSHQDEQTFEEQMGMMDWAVMFILARGGETYARLRYQTSFGSEIVLLTPTIDWSAECPAIDHSAWEAEYNEKVSQKTYTIGYQNTSWESDYSHCRSEEVRDSPMPTKNDLQVYHAGFNSQMAVRTSLFCKIMPRMVHQRCVHELLGDADHEMSLFDVPVEKLARWCKDSNTHPFVLLNNERIDWKLPPLWKHAEGPSIEEIDMIFGANNISYDVTELPKWFSKIYGWSDDEVMQCIGDAIIASDDPNTPKRLKTWIENASSTYTADSNS